MPTPTNPAFPTGPRRHRAALGAAACAALAGPAAGCGPDTAGTLTHTLAWHQAAGTEIQDCHVFKLDNAEAVEVDQISAALSAGAHHVQVYRSDTPEPDGVTDCQSGVDWERWHLVLGARAPETAWELPDGVAIPFDRRQQLLVQVHGLNPVAGPIDGKVELAFETTDRAVIRAGAMIGINKQTAMQPLERKVLRTWCPLPAGSSVLAVMGHYHGLGRRYAVTSRAPDAQPAGLVLDTAAVIYEAGDEQTLEFERLEPAFEVPTGHGLEFECDFFNHRDVAVAWSADTRFGEHCDLVAYYYPAGDAAPPCTVEATEVRSIDGPKRGVLPGEPLIYAVDLTEHAPRDLDVELSVSDRTVLDAPRTLHVPAGTKTLTFEARALRPARVSVTARLGSTSQSVTTAVAGLVLSEVYTGESGQTDRRQWVEIANRTGVAIDLSRYSLGAGKEDYTRTRVPLSITVPPRGCVVVGGPLLTHPGQPAYDQAIDFAPSLGLGGSDASGIALFDATSDRIDALALPYDALVYGDHNGALLDPSGQLAPAVPRPPAKGTYHRASEGRWEPRSLATPRLCEVLEAP